MTKALLMFIGGGVLSALLYLSVVTGGMGALILAYLAPLPLLMVGLGAGFRPFAIAATSAVAVVGLFGGPLFGLTYAMANGVRRGRDRSAGVAGKVWPLTAAWNGIRRVFCWSY